MRSYARLLKLPAEEIIQAFNDLGLREELSEHIVPPRLYKQYNIQTRSMRWVSATVACTLLLLVFVWWHGQHKTIDNNTLVLPEMHLAANTNATQEPAIGPVNNNQQDVQQATVAQQQYNAVPDLQHAAKQDDSVDLAQEAHSLMQGRVSK